MVNEALESVKRDDKSQPKEMYRRVLDVIQRRAPDQYPFVTRLETWFKSHKRSGTLPERFINHSLMDLHREIGVGQLKFMVPYAFKLCNTEVASYRNEKLIFREFEPEFENLPGFWDIISTEHPGETYTEICTPVGTLSLTHLLLPEGVASGTDPYLKEHLIKSEADIPAIEYLVEHSQFVPRFEQIMKAQVEMKGNGFVVPLLHRIPFQQILLEYFGEMQLFYKLHDSPGLINRLMNLLDDQMMDILTHLAEFDWPYVEFPDNLHGLMTNPNLFREFCLPGYQKYTQVLHQQGKKTGSHTDGNVKPLLALLKESGLDVAESFSPAPLTPCTFKEAWDAWQDGPIIWGGIPSPLLEVSTKEADFHDYLEQVLTLVNRKPIIFGVTDLFMKHNSIDRVEWIVKELKKIDLMAGINGT